MPNVVSVAIIGIIFSNMFSHFGVINRLLTDGHIIKENIDWFDHKWTSLFSLAFTDTWHTFGINLLYFLSALNNIPEDIYESARLDGASELRIFWTIAMPMVKPAWLTLIVFSFKDLWSQGPSIYIQSEQLKTFPYAVSQILAAGIVRTGAQAASSFILMLVPIVVFIITQSNVIETMGSSGMKD